MSDQAPTCTRCGATPLTYDKRVGLWRARNETAEYAHTYCWGEWGGHFPSWKHTPRPLTPRQQAALSRWQAAQAATL